LTDGKFELRSAFNLYTKKATIALTEIITPAIIPPIVPSEIDGDGEGKSEILAVAVDFKALVNTAEEHTMTVVMAVVKAGGNDRLMVSIIALGTVLL
jgi:hypothetical protein